MALMKCVWKNQFVMWPSLSSEACDINAEGILTYANMMPLSSAAGKLCAATYTGWKSILDKVIFVSRQTGDRCATKRSAELESQLSVISAGNVYGVFRVRSDRRSWSESASLMLAMIVYIKQIHPSASWLTAPTPFYLASARRHLIFANICDSNYLMMASGCNSNDGCLTELELSG